MLICLPQHTVFFLSSFLSHCMNKGGGFSGSDIRVVAFSAAARLVQSLKRPLRKKIKPYLGPF